MKSIILTAAALCTLAACTAEIPPYRWHRTGASESEVSRQINICKSQAQHDAKHGNTPKPLEQCMDEAGYYRYERGNL